MPEYVEEFNHLLKQNRRIKKRNRGLASFLIIIVIFFLILLGLIIYQELEGPVFGGWVKTQEEYITIQQSHNQLNLKLDSLQQANQLLMENSPNYNGVFFEVQIGAFRHFNIQSYNEQLNRFHQDQIENLSKYTVGKFREYEQAKQFRKDIRQLGIEDAFIVAKIDGQRVDVQTALKQAGSTQ
ncbi:MAG: hypothetical protein ACNS62_09155 [Candidatus Cyclobacteriaceae bacterium M3_2C_046]